MPKGQPANRGVRGRREESAAQVALQVTLPERVVGDSQMR